MNVAPHLIRLYLKTSRRYKKLVARLKRHSTTEWERKTFLGELRKLVRRLRKLQLQLKLAAATGTVALMLNANQAQAQSTSALGPFVRQERTHNPLREPIFSGSTPALTVVDVDNDGDFDVVQGTYSWYGGFLRYFENQSVQGFPVYIEREGELNPFDGIRAETTSVAPAFADLDGDGDLDLFLGQNGWTSYYGNTDSGVEYYRNDEGVFGVQTGPWNETTAEGNPFDGVELGSDVRPNFVDLDKDGDLDVIMGSTVWQGPPYYTSISLHYFENNGSGTFTQAPITINAQLNAYGTISPAAADLDNDGDYDILMGAYNYDELIYLEQVAPGSFELASGNWDPAAGTGNPMNGFKVGERASPAFIDFDQDGHLDLFVADERSYYSYKYSDGIINYYKNQGDNTFEEIKGFENPFVGAFVDRAASPVLVDLDGDLTLDAVVGNKYNGNKYDPDEGGYVFTQSSLAYYRKNEAGSFDETAEESDPFYGIEIDGFFSPQFIDMDSDGDLDMITGSGAGQVLFFRNDEGAYIDATDTSPFTNVYGYYQTTARLVDIDNDGDLDLFMGNGYGELHFYENEGGSYVEKTGSENPLTPVVPLVSYPTPMLTFTDLDHDGDYDLILSTASKYRQDPEQLTWFENIGTPEQPEFGPYFEDVFPEVDNTMPQTHFIDYDEDGDLDLFSGDYSGTVSYYENQNERVTTTTQGSTIVYDTDGDPVVIEPALTLEDADSDFIIHSTVSIEAFESGEKLDFTPVEGINGFFNSGTGVLTFRGKATVEDYQALLRTVTFEIDASAGRKGDPKHTLIDKTISFSVFDEDFTHPQVAAKSLQIFVNDPPAAEAAMFTLTVGGSIVIDLKDLISDPNGAAELDLGSLQVISAPGSGAIASVGAGGMLTVDYVDLDFLGNETLAFEVCDLDGLCASNVITLTVTNTPPVIQPEPVSTPAGAIKTLNLMEITSDVDDNLDPEGFTIVQQPASGARAVIEQLSESQVNLILDYQGITFSGTDALTIRACDKAGACTDHLLELSVSVDEGGVIVYNAVAPNSSGDNRFMRIMGLSADHKVTIFNRWGDKVFETTQYQNADGANAFRGESDNGNALASGTYFYLIEMHGKPSVTGYLTLKQ